jgi:hypothetical protein
LVGTKEIKSMKTLDIREPIPAGFRAVIIPEKVFNFLMNRQDWTDIEEPTIAQVAEFCCCSVRTIKEDLKKADCPLRVSTKGKRGRGAQTMFHKFTVEQYKKYKQG